VQVSTIRASTARTDPPPDGSEHQLLGLEQLGSPEGPGQPVFRPGEAAGLILVSGPEGSGKSTTLYSLLRKMTKPTRRSSPWKTRQAPPGGVTQIEFNRKAGLTLAGNLRLILKQDPDVVYLKEILTPSRQRSPSRRHYPATGS